MMRWKLSYKEEVNSTNDCLKELGKSGFPEGTALLATRQTAGRGRLERYWESPPDQGLYLSWLLRPPRGFNSYELLNVLTAVPIAQKMCHLYNLHIQLKWSNDLMVNNRKLGGILGETVGRGTKNSFLVIGLGINCSQQREDFPAEIRERATSLRLEGVSGCQPMELAPILLDAFSPLYEDIVSGLHSCWIDEYKSISCTIGRTVEKDGEIGLALGLGERGELVIKLGDGRLTRWEL